MAGHEHRLTARHRAVGHIEPFDQLGALGHGHHQLAPIQQRIHPVGQVVTCRQAAPLALTTPPMTTRPRSKGLPADPIEALVVTQLCDALRAPPLVQAVWDRVRRIAPGMREPQVVLPMRRLAELWSTLFPAEQRRLAQLLIERVVIGTGAWRSSGTIPTGSRWPRS